MTPLRLMPPARAGELRADSVPEYGEALKAWPETGPGLDEVPPLIEPQGDESFDDMPQSGMSVAEAGPKRPLDAAAAVAARGGLEIEALAAETAALRTSLGRLSAYDARVWVAALREWGADLQGDVTAQLERDLETLRGQVPDADAALLTKYSAAFKRIRIEQAAAHA